MLFFIFMPMLAIGVAATRSNFTGGEKVGIAILAIVVGLIASLGAQFTYGLLVGLFVGLAGAKQLLQTLPILNPGGSRCRQSSSGWQQVA